MKKLSFAFAIALLTSMPALAHHNWASGYYIDDPEIEVEGVISSVTWTNPHIRVGLTVDIGKPTEKEWLLESGSVSMLSRMNISGDMVKIGDKVKVAGWKARHSDHGLYLNHLLLPTGVELTLQRDFPPFWPDAVAHVGDTDKLSGRVLEEDISKRPTSLFAVWNTIYGDPNSHGLTKQREEQAARLEAAEERGIAPPPPADDPNYSIDVYACDPKSMPRAMGNPYPIEFSKVGDDIKLQLEEYDLVRMIHMTDKHDDSGVEPSLMGYSTGVWLEPGIKLQVTTTKVNDSPAARYTETFEMRDDREHVDYTRVAVENGRTSSTSKYWEYVPGTEIQPYNCTREISK